MSNAEKKSYTVLEDGTPFGAKGATVLLNKAQAKYPLISGQIEDPVAAAAAKKAKPAPAAPTPSSTEPQPEPPAKRR